MTEQQILSWLEQQRGVSGMGDDAFVLPGSPQDLVFTTDMLVEGVHFKRSLRPEEVGYRALARGLSDVAAMLATPRFCLLSVAFPPWASETYIQRFYKGLLRLANVTKCPLTGGDLSHAPKLTADITVCGAVPHGRAALRSGAKPGDRIYVSGALGGNAASGYCWRPRPRLELVCVLRTQVSACMDITDGLALDLHRLCLASNVSAQLDTIPIAENATEAHALSGGEDYELLFTSRLDLPFPAIGRIVEGAPGAITLRGEPLEPTGYDHFRRDAT
jgi:thiamine-monophosphate kinase